MKPSNAATVRVVTPEQLRDGYLELRGVIAHPRKFHVIRKLPDGNYVVKEPQSV